MNGKVCKGLFLIFWFFASVISLNHLHPFFSCLSTMPIQYVGLLGWVTALLACIVFAKGYERQVFAVGIIFFLLGFRIGPFLEPPADPLEHLRRIHEETCNKTIEELPRSNRGLWHYSMAGIVLCGGEGKLVVPETMLQRINIVNGMFWALGSSVLFILGVGAGLPMRWAFLSVVTCFLFFGTNRFNYFRYYSLAPSFTSLCIYWFWIALFFFRKRAADIIKGLAVALSALPILWVNHNQEVVFLVFIIALWLSILCLEKRIFVIPSQLQKYIPPKILFFFSIRFIYFIIFFIIFWILPQSTPCLHWLAHFFSRGRWPHYQSLYVQWHGLYIGGKITGFRIMDTLGGISIVSAVLAVPYFYFGFSAQRELRVRLFILAILPFIVYFTPLLHFVWSSNVRAAEYYRFCYASVFWLFFSRFLFELEMRICKVSSDAFKALPKRHESDIS